MLGFLLYPLLLLPTTLIVIPGFILAVAISWIFSLAVKLIAHLIRPKITRFDDIGAVWSADNVHKRPYTNIILYLVCQGNITIEQLRSQVRSTLLSNTPESRRKFWRLRQRWTTFLGYLFWEPVPNFDVNEHVRLYDLDGPGLRLPSMVRDEDLNRITSSYVTIPYPGNSSPWELLLIPNYLPRNNGKQDGQPYCVLAVKIHHAMADGSGCDDFMESLFTAEHAVTTVERLNKFPHYTRLQKTLRNLSIAASAPFDMTKLTCEWIRGQNEWCSLVGKLSQEYYTYFSAAIPLNSFRKIQKRYGVSSTAVFHTLATGAMLKMMKENGQKIPEAMCVLFAYPLQGHPGGLINHFTTNRFSFNPKLNMRIESRLKAIAPSVPSVDVTRQSYPTYFAWLNAAWALLPAKLVHYWYILSSFTATLTYVPGPPQELEIEGKIKLVEILPFLGFPPATCGCVVAGMSYGGNVRLGMCVDRQNMPRGAGSSRRMAVCLNEGLNELLKQC